MRTTPSSGSPGFLDDGQRLPDRRKLLNATREGRALLEGDADDLDVVVVRVRNRERLPRGIEVRIRNTGVHKTTVNRLRREDVLVRRPRAFRAWGSPQGNSRPVCIWSA